MYPLQTLNTLYFHPHEVCTWSFSSRLYRSFQSVCAGVRVTEDSTSFSQSKPQRFVKSIERGIPGSRLTRAQH